MCFIEAEKQEETGSMEIQVALKSIGKKKAVQAMPLKIQGHPATVRELILAVTEAEVLLYNQRAQQSGLLQSITLTREEIEDKAQAGRIRICRKRRKMRYNALRMVFTGFFWIICRWKRWMIRFV